MMTENGDEGMVHKKEVRDAARGVAYDGGACVFLS
jgi:hypothetical protein